MFMHHSRGQAIPDYNLQVEVEAMEEWSFMSIEI
jgi:hypothetical protein